MGREVTKDIAIQHKKHAIRKVNNVFEAFINNPDDKYLKKADLLLTLSEDAICIMARKLLRLFIG